MKLLIYSHRFLFNFFGNVFFFFFTFFYSILCQLLLVGGHVDGALKELDRFCSNSQTAIPFRYTFLAKLCIATGSQYVRNRKVICTLDESFTNLCETLGELQLYVIIKKKRSFSIKFLYHKEASYYIDRNLTT